MAAGEGRELHAEVIAASKKLARGKLAEIPEMESTTNV